MPQLTNGHTPHITTAPDRADEINDLLKAVQEQLIPFIRTADAELQAHREWQSGTRPSIPPPPSSPLDLTIPTRPLGAPGLLSTLNSLLSHSVNTFSPGFLDKLYAGTNAPGIAAELILACLNTNLHVYQVSPALTRIEQATTKALAALFGLDGPRAGGISVQGGSASNLTSIVVARNTLFPRTKIGGLDAVERLDDGNRNGKRRRLMLFTSAHGHYSIEKAAQACGFGSGAVVGVPVDAATGAMTGAALEECIVRAKEDGNVPFYVNATAGTTVLGSFDRFIEIAEVARRHGCWFHVDASWGGGFVFSDTLRAKLAGVELADSVAFNPHKMLGVPLTCSFLLARDLRTLQKANTLKAGYLFHSGDEDEEEEEEDDDDWAEPMDLADLTLQCGRRGDSLKLFLSWQYYGTQGYGDKVDRAYAVARHFAGCVMNEKDLVLVSEQTPPCSQVCFYYAPNGKLLFGEAARQLRPESQSGANGLDLATQTARMNGKVTAAIAGALVARGFMVDFAPALESQPEVGKFLRCVVNLQTIPETIERLVKDVVEVGKDVIGRIRDQHKIVIESGQEESSEVFSGGTGKNFPEHGNSISTRKHDEQSTCQSMLEGILA